MATPFEIDAAYYGFSSDANSPDQAAYNTETSEMENILANFRPNTAKHDTTIVGYDETIYDNAGRINEFFENLRLTSYEKSLHNDGYHNIKSTDRSSNAGHKYFDYFLYTDGRFRRSTDIETLDAIISYMNTDIPCSADTYVDDPSNYQRYINTVYPATQDDLDNLYTIITDENNPPPIPPVLPFEFFLGKKILTTHTVILERLIVIHRNRFTNGISDDSVLLDKLLEAFNTWKQVNDIFAKVEQPIFDASIANNQSVTLGTVPSYNSQYGKLSTYAGNSVFNSDGTPANVVYVDGTPINYDDSSPVDYSLYPSLVPNEGDNIVCALSSFSNSGNRAGVQRRVIQSLERVFTEVLDECPTFPTEPPVQENCNLDPMNIIVLLDGTGSMGGSKYTTSLDALESLVDQFAPGGSPMRIIQWASNGDGFYDPKPEFTDDTTILKDSVRLHRENKLGVYTSIMPALRKVKNIVETELSGSSLETLLIIITDGAIQDLNANDSQFVRNYLAKQVYRLGIHVRNDITPLSAVKRDVDKLKSAIGFDLYNENCPNPGTGYQNIHTITTSTLTKDYSPLKQICSLDDLTPKLDASCPDPPPEFPAPEYDGEGNYDLDIIILYDASGTSKEIPRSINSQDTLIDIYTNCFDELVQNSTLTNTTRDLPVEETNTGTRYAFMQYGTQNNFGLPTGITNDNMFSGDLGELQSVLQYQKDNHTPISQTTVLDINSALKKVLDIALANPDRNLSLIIVSQSPFTGYSITELGSLQTIMNIYGISVYEEETTISNSEFVLSQVTKDYKSTNAFGFTQNISPIKNLCEFDGIKTKTETEAPATRIPAGCPGLKLDLYILMDFSGSMSFKSNDPSNYYYGDAMKPAFLTEVQRFITNTNLDGNFTGTPIDTTPDPATDPTQEGIRIGLSAYDSRSFTNTNRVSGDIDEINADFAYFNNGSFGGGATDPLQALLDLETTIGNDDSTRDPDREIAIIIFTDGSISEIDKCKEVTNRLLTNYNTDSSALHLFGIFIYKNTINTPYFTRLSTLLSDPSFAIPQSIKDFETDAGVLATLTNGCSKIGETIGCLKPALESKIVTFEDLPYKSNIAVGASLYRRYTLRRSTQDLFKTSHFSGKLKYLVTSTIPNNPTTLPVLFGFSDNLGTKVILVVAKFSNIDFNTPGAIQLIDITNNDTLLAQNIPLDNKSSNNPNIVYNTKFNINVQTNILSNAVVNLNIVIGIEGTNAYQHFAGTISLTTIPGKISLVHAQSNVESHVTDVIYDESVPGTEVFNSIENIIPKVNPSSVVCGMQNTPILNKYVGIGEWNLGFYDPDDSTSDAGSVLNRLVSINETFGDNLTPQGIILPYYQKLNEYSGLNWRMNLNFVYDDITSTTPVTRLLFAVETPVRDANFTSGVWTDKGRQEVFATAIYQPSTSNYKVTFTIVKGLLTSSASGYVIHESFDVNMATGHRAQLQFEEQKFKVNTLDRNNVCTPAFEIIDVQDMKLISYVSTTQNQPNYTLFEVDPSISDNDPNAEFETPQLCPPAWPSADCQVPFSILDLVVDSTDTLTQVLVPDFKAWYEADYTTDSIINNIITHNGDTLTIITSNQTVPDQLTVTDVLWANATVTSTTSNLSYVTNKPTLTYELYTSAITDSEHKLYVKQTFTDTDGTTLVHDFVRDYTCGDILTISASIKNPGDPGPVGPDIPVENEILEKSDIDDLTYSAEGLLAKPLCKEEPFYVSTDKTRAAMLSDAGLPLFTVGTDDYFYADGELADNTGTVVGTELKSDGTFTIPEPLCPLVVEFLPLDEGNLLINVISYDDGACKIQTGCVPYRPGQRVSNLSNLTVNDLSNYPSALVATQETDLENFECPPSEPKIYFPTTTPPEGLVTKDPNAPPNPDAVVSGVANSVAVAFKDSILIDDEGIIGEKTLAVITNEEDEVITIKAEQDIDAGEITLKIEEEGVELPLTDPLTFPYDPTEFNLLGLVYEPGYVEITVGDGATTTTDTISTKSLSRVKNYVMSPDSAYEFLPIPEIPKLPEYTTIFDNFTPPSSLELEPYTKLLTDTLVVDPVEVPESEEKIKLRKVATVPVGPATDPSGPLGPQGKIVSEPSKTKNPIFCQTSLQDPCRPETVVIGMCTVRDPNANFQVVVGCSPVDPTDPSIPGPDKFDVRVITEDGATIGTPGSCTLNEVISAGDIVQVGVEAVDNVMCRAVVSCIPTRDVTEAATIATSTTCCSEFPLADFGATADDEFFVFAPISVDGYVSSNLVNCPIPNSTGEFITPNNPPCDLSSFSNNGGGSVVEVELPCGSRKRRIFTEFETDPAVTGPGGLTPDPTDPTDPAVPITVAPKYYTMVDNNIKAMSYCITFRYNRETDNDGGVKHGMVCGSRYTRYDGSSMNGYITAKVTNGTGGGDSTVKFSVDEYDSVTTGKFAEFTNVQDEDMFACLFAPNGKNVTVDTTKPGVTSQNPTQGQDCPIIIVMCISSDWSSLRGLQYLHLDDDGTSPPDTSTLKVDLYVCNEPDSNFPDLTTVTDLDISEDLLGLGENRIFEYPQIIPSCPSTLCESLEWPAPDTDGTNVNSNLVPLIEGKKFHVEINLAENVNSLFKIYTPLTIDETVVQGKNSR